MGQTMNRRNQRGFSIMSVLAAMIILMAVLVPLLSLQGRLFEQVAMDEVEAMYQVIEEDMDNLAGTSGKIRTRRIQSGEFEIRRQVNRVQNNLLLIQYEVRRSSDAVALKVNRYLFKR